MFPKFFHNATKGKIFDENFLMVSATIGALILREFSEATAVMALYNLGELLEDFAVSRSRRSVAELLANKNQKVKVRKNDRWVEVDPKEVQPEDIILVAPGEKILLDGVILQGSSYLDTSSITGESLPLLREKGDEVLSGTINGEGSLLIRVTKTYRNSTIQIITQFLESALQKKATTERFITRFARFYTPLVAILALSLFLIPFILTRNDFSFHLYRALTVLMISCPCALVISTPLGFMIGIGKSAREGILVKGSSFLEKLAHLQTILFDKTGTLTEGKFNITIIQPFNGTRKEDLLRLAALLASRSRHPLAKTIQKSWGETQNIDFDFYQETPGLGIRAKISQKELLLGNTRFLEQNGVSLFSSPTTSSTAVHLAQNGMYLGYIVFEDTIKNDARKTIQALTQKGIQVCLLSGDTQESVAKVAQDLGITHFFAELLPQQKVALLETILEKKNPRTTVAFVGDGMNDAPAMALADLGIVMGRRGIDVAIETADIVLITDELSRLERAIHIAHQTQNIIWQNIGFSIGMKFIFLFLAFFGMVSLWEAVFADVGIMFLAILNSLRIMR
ncbi:MAG: heavy metal translocating P-type ATPase [Candidatus Caldatribacteriaceae bacterium]